MPERLRSIVVLGGDAAAASVAAAIASTLRDADVAITLVDDATQYSGVEAADSSTVRFHRLLGINEASLVTNTGSTFRLGSEYLDWKSPGHRFLLASGSSGISIRMVPFHQYMIWQHFEGKPADCNHYSLAACAAEAGRFAHPGNDPNAVTSTFEYGLQLDRQRYAQAMTGIAGNFGVRHMTSKAVGAFRSAETGHVESVRLENGDSVEGDLFIDCGGFLADQLPDFGPEDWSDYLPCDRAVTVASAAVADMHPVNRIIAKDVGWQRRVQLLDRAEFELFYNSESVSDDAVTTLMLKDIPEVSGESARRTISRTVHKKPWRDNIVLIGRAAADIEELETSTLSRAHAAALNLLMLLPDRDCDPVLASEFNRVHSLQLDRTRDLQGLFYALTQREAADFWRRRLRRSEALQQRLDLFASTGRIEHCDFEPCTHDYLAAIMLGLDFWPEAYDPMVNAAELAVVESQLPQMREYLGQVVKSMPSHAQSLRMMAERSRNKQ